MNPCKDCIVDMICTTKCPLFEINMERLQTDEELYLKRCMNNSKNETTYNLSNNIQVDICDRYIVWLKNGNRHRDNDRPAIITYGGNRYWYKNGKIHRDNDKPATIYYDGNQFWYKNGKAHRDNDQPAAIWIDGTQSWYTNGVRYEPM